MASEKAQDAIGPAGAFDPRRDSTKSAGTAAKIIHNAKAATEKEHRMSLWEGIKTYPKAVGWSVLISTCIAMEGYDISLVNNFYAFPQFNRKYGELTPKGTYEVPARVGSPHPYSSFLRYLC
jgi:SP family general alpha glucoside:H+ symporter-like MFS transporter